MKRLLLIGLTLGLAACSPRAVTSDDGSVGPPPSPPPPSPQPQPQPQPQRDLGIPPVPPPPGTGFVISQIVLPLNTTDAQRYADDLDNDGTPDNQLGAILAALGGAAPGGIRLQPSLDEGINRGKAPLLLSIAPFALPTTAKAILSQWNGKPADCCQGTADPALCAKLASAKCFRGKGVFYGEKVPWRLDGTITANILSFGPGPLRFRLQLGSKSVAFDLIAGRLRGVVKGGWIRNGVISGAIPMNQFQSWISLLAHEIDIAYHDPKTPGSTRTQLGNLFDQNKDNTISLAEFRGNALIQAFLAGDIDANGDGKLELSFGFAFTAVSAIIK